MTTALDSTLPPRVLEIVNERGKTVTITVTSNTYSASTGKNSASSATTYPDLKISPPAPYESRHVDGTMIQAHDMHCILPASGLGFTPSIEDEITVTFDSVVWSVAGFDPMYSGDDVAAYKLQLRR